MGIHENSKMSETDSSNEQVILTTVGYDHVIKFWQAHIMTRKPWLRLRLQTASELTRSMMFVRDLQILLQ